jgi:hypothetical protein
MRYVRALGADIILGFTNTNGVRFLNDASRAVVLDALSHMSPTMATQMPAVDAYGARIIYSPGLIPLPGIPNGRDMLVQAAATGQTVLISENFADDNEQVIRLVTNPAFLPALTDPALGGAMAVLLMPQGQAIPTINIPGLPPLSTPSPATPTTPPPVGAQVPAAPKPAEATILGMPRNAALAVGAGLVGLTLLVVLSKGKR